MSVPSPTRRARARTIAAGAAIALAATTSVSLAAPASAAESTITVGQGGYATIASAIADIAPNGTINVPPGTYAETLTINKAGVTLNGASAGISAGVGGARNGDTSENESVVTGGIFVTAADVTIDGFEIRSPTASVKGVRITANDAVVRNNRIIGPDSGSSYGIQNYNVVERIENNLFLDHFRAINHDGSYGGVVTGNDFRDNPLAIASGADDGVITDNRFVIPAGGYQAIGLYGARNEITGNTVVAEGAVADGYGAVVFYGGTKRISENVIAQNTFSGAGPALSISNNSFADDNEIADNAFLNTGVVLRSGDTDDDIDLTQNWWGTEGGPAEDAVDSAGGAFVTSPALSAEITDLVAPTTVSSTTTAVDPVATLRNERGVTTTISGATDLAFGPNTVTAESVLTINGAPVATDTATLVVTRSSARSAVNITAPNPRQAFRGTPTTIQVKVAVAAAGTMQMLLDGAPAASVAVRDGIAEWTLPAKLPIGWHSVSATFLPSTPAAESSSSGTAFVRVVKATSQVTLKTSRAKQKFEGKKQARLTASVTLVDSAARTKGFVTFRTTWGAKLGTAQVRDGKAKLTLDKAVPVGRHRITATFVPANENVSRSRSAAVKVRVRR
jgi:hypothetical protein